MNRLKSKIGWLILKLDIKKAFDSISWSFILHILRAFNIPSQWTKLIESCFSNMEYTPILNGSKLTPFKPTRGIRQGDSISPYLFILAMEYLSILINHAINNKTLRPFKFKSHNLEVSHLLFADDVLLFAKADNTSINTINSIIHDFCNTSGMEINLDKSKLWLSPSVPQVMKQSISNTLGVPLTQNLGTYLGFQLKTNYKAIDFNNINLKMHHKLSCWKTHLPFAG